jgi:hypothetical protein
MRPKPQLCPWKMKTPSDGMRPPPSLSSEYDTAQSGHIEEHSKAPGLALRRRWMIGRLQWIRTGWPAPPWPPLPESGALPG